MFSSITSSSHQPRLDSEDQQDLQIKISLTKWRKPKIGKEYKSELWQCPFTRSELNLDLLTEYLATLFENEQDSGPSLQKRLRICYFDGQDFLIIDSDDIFKQALFQPRPANTLLHLWVSLKRDLCKQKQLPPRPDCNLCNRTIKTRHVMNCMDCTATEHQSLCVNCFGSLVKSLKKETDPAKLHNFVAIARNPVANLTPSFNAELAALVINESKPVAGETGPSSEDDDSRSSCSWETLSEKEAGLVEDEADCLTRSDTISLQQQHLASNIAAQNSAQGFPFMMPPTTGAFPTSQQQFMGQQMPMMPPHVFYPHMPIPMQMPQQYPPMSFWMPQLASPSATRNDASHQTEQK